MGRTNVRNLRKEKKWLKIDKNNKSKMAVKDKEHAPSLRMTVIHMRVIEWS